MRIILFRRRIMDISCICHSPEFRKQIPSRYSFLCSSVVRSCHCFLFQQSGENFSPIFLEKLSLFFTEKNFYRSFFLMSLNFSVSLPISPSETRRCFLQGGLSPFQDIAAWILHIPVLLMNLTLFRELPPVCENLHDVLYHFPGNPVESGNTYPSGNSSRKFNTGKEFLQFSEEKPFSWIGGSRRSQFLNTLLNASDRWALPEMNIVWITGSANEQSIVLV